MDKSIFTLGFAEWLRGLATQPCWECNYRYEFGYADDDGPEDMVMRRLNTGSKAEIYFLARKSPRDSILWEINLTFDKNYTVKLYSGVCELAKEDKFAGVLAAATAAIQLHLE